MIKKLLLPSIFIICFIFTTIGQTTINAQGAGTYTVPAGVTSITVQAWGGGGAGGGGNTNGVTGGGGGGAGGTYVSSVLVVTPGQNINYYVGAGSAGANANGSAGEATWFNAVGVLYAQGGNGGTAPSNGTALGGLGSIASSIGTIRTPGANGANGTTTVGGAGGQGGGALGGAGGLQRTTTRGTGNPGVQPGGGGGGAFKTNNQPQSGGNGGNGRLIITAANGPANDAICSATPAPVNSDNLCASTVSGTVTSATNSGINSCPSGTPDDDVWYSFVAVATSHNISLINVAGGTTDLYHAVYSGTCGSPTLVSGSCSDPNSSTVAGLTPGNTYFIQVYSWSANAQTSTFDLCIGTNPVCATPIRSTGPIAFGTITDVSINASFPAAVPAPDNYIVIRSLSATPPTLTNGATYTIGQIFGAYTVVDTDANTNFTSTGLTQTTPYYFYIFSMNNLNCTGGPIYSTNSLNGTASTVVATYCTPSSTLTGYYINNFSTSGGVTDISHVNSGFSPGGYGNFTAQNVTQYPGSAITFLAEHVGGSFQTNIWVDWDGDLVFSAAEKVYDSPGYLNNTTGSFNVLATAVVGDYRMRVRSAWFNSNVSACGFEDRSETHDYTLTVTPLNCTANPLSLAAVTTSATTGTISWTGPVPAPVNGYEYIVSTDNSTATPASDITGTTSAVSVNLTGLTAGTTYYVFVRGLCTAPDNGVWIPTTFTTACGNIVTTQTACPVIIDQQGNDPFTANPFVANPSAALGCGNTSVTLVANSNIRETSSYIVEQTTYPDPAPRYDFPLIGGTNPEVITNDDVWADTRTNIGFDFCFYNERYTQALTGANGALTFDPNIAPGSSSGYAITNNIPSLAGALFEFTIYGVYQDLDPRGLVGTPIKSRTIGAPGCRQFQVSWNDIPMYSDSSRLFTGMIVLHESTNIIEVFIKEKRIENGNINPWNGGNALVGIQGDITPLPPNNQALAAPCRNSLDTNWETTNEAWRFTPNGPVINPSSITWYQGSVAPGNIVASNPDNSLTVLTGGTYIAVATYNNLCGVSVTLSDDIVVTDSRKTWNGSIDTNWATANNWTPIGVPISTDCITVPVTANGRYPIINGTTDGNGYSILVLAGANVLMQSNSTLTIVDQVNVATGAAFTLEDSASLIQVNNVTNVGTITMNRDTNIRRQDYVYWSTPVNAFPLASVVPTSSPNFRYEWNPSLDRPDGPPPGNVPNDYGIWEVASGNMVTGKGYAIRGPNGFDNITPAIFQASFIGTPNNGTFNVPIRRGAYAANGNYIDQGGQITKDDDNWNFVGNPYPSAIDAKAFLTLNTDIDGTVYLWTHGTRIQQGVGSPFYGTYVYNYNISDYLEYNLSGPSSQSGFEGFIGAGQGFYVLMNECPTPTAGLCPAPATSSVTFNNAMRTNSAGYRNDQFFRTTEEAEPLKDRIWLDLVSPTGGTSTALVAYAQGATNEVDRLYDARSIGGVGKDLYSLLYDENYVIQGRQHPLNTDDQITLGITTEESGIFNIAIHGVDGLFDTTNQDIFLEDKLLNVIHDLRNLPYVFTLTEAGTYNDRFVLRYNDQTLGIDSLQNSVFNIIGVDNEIKVTSGNSPINSVIVYDILGRVLADYKNVNLLDFKFKLVNQSKGTLIIKATLFNGQQKIKRIIY